MCVCYAILFCALILSYALDSEKFFTLSKILGGIGVACAAVQARFAYVVMKTTEQLLEESETYPQEAKPLDCA